MINLLYSIYSIIAGVFAYIIVTGDIELAILFLLIWEFIIFLFYRRRKYPWNLKKRIIFCILYFLGYFSSFLLYNDLKFEKDF